MNHRRTAFVALSLLSATAALGQVGSYAQGSALIKTDQAPNPCDNLGTPNNPYTMMSCWNCYTSLVRDCDRQFNEMPQRAACYKAANDLLNFCLTRTVPAAPGNPVTPRPRSEVVRTGEGLAYEAAFTYPVNPNNIAVYVIGPDERFKLVDAFVTPNADGSVGVFIEASSFDFPANTVFGVVTAVKEAATHRVVGASADAYTLLDVADVNRDGSVDIFDLVDVLENENMTEEDVQKFLVDFAGR